MTTDIATRLGNTLMGAVVQPLPTVRVTAAAAQPGFWHKLGRAVFTAPGHFMAHLQRRQAERDALIRYAMTEGKELGLGRSEIERAVLLTGRADMLFPSYFINAQRR
jgi:hypothetical protein